MQPKTETAGAPREGNRPQISALGQAQSNCNPVDLILSRLEGTKRYGDGYTAKCPAHQDRHASLSVCEGDDGRALVQRPRDPEALPE